MGTREKIEQLLSELGPLLELDAVVAYENLDSWGLIIDEDRTVTVEADFVGRKLILSTALPAPPAKRRADTYEMLLIFNAHWEESGGLQIGLEEPGGKLSLSYHQALPGLDIDELEAIIKSFVVQADLWADITAKGLSESDPVEESKIPEGLVRE